MVKRICYITPSVELLGARISLVELLQKLDRGKYQPLVICPKDGPLCQQLSAIDVEYRIIKFGNWRKVKFWPLIPSAIFNLTELGREVNASLFHSNEFWSYPYAHLTAKRLSIPSICHFRCSRDPYQLPPRKLKNYFVPRADQIIALSKSQEILLNRVNGINSKISVIPNGVDIDRFESADGTLFRKELGIHNDAHLIGMVGPVSEHKGVEDFIWAASTLLKKMPDLHFAIVGPDRPRSFTIRMKQLVKDENIDAHFTFTGFRKDIPSIMSSLDILVTPSHVEAFGRVLLEAMSAGTPVIASKVGGIPEIISCHEVGILVEPRHPDGLAENIFNLLKSSEDRSAIVKRAKSYVKQYYSIDIHAQKIQSIYDKLLGN